MSAVAADVGVIHFIDDSDRTSDSEFGEAMANMGLTQYRRKVKTLYHSDGVKIDQVNEVTINQDQAHEEINVLDDGLEDMEFMNNRTDGSEADDEDSDFDVPAEELNVDSSTLPGCDSDDEVHTKELNASCMPSLNSNFEMPPEYLNHMPSRMSSYRQPSQSNHDYDDKVDGKEVKHIMI
ncbi:hypothetical protein LINPERPRIM_LOCUS17457 [Linum perenne]